MKKLLIGMLVIASVSAFAEDFGTPEQDPLVRLLQEKFQQSKAPDSSDLQLGKSWKCQVYMAIKNNNKNRTQNLRFLPTQIEGIIYDENSEQFYFTATGHFIFESTGIVAVFKNGLDSKDGSIVQYRVAPNGDLYGEFSLPKKSIAMYPNKAELVTQAIYNPNYIAWAYSTCK